MNENLTALLFIKIRVKDLAPPKNEEASDEE
jgi:hypothetical protein